MKTLEMRQALDGPLLFRLTQRPGSRAEIDACAPDLVETVERWLFNGVVGPLRWVNGRPQRPTVQSDDAGFLEALKVDLEAHYTMPVMIHERGERR